MNQFFSEVVLAINFSLDYLVEYPDTAAIADIPLDWLAYLLDEKAHGCLLSHKKMPPNCIRLPRTPIR